MMWKKRMICVPSDYRLSLILKAAHRAAFFFIFITYAIHIRTSRHRFACFYPGIVLIVMLVILIARLLTGINLKLSGHVIVTGISALLISLMLTPQFLRQK